MTRLVAYAAASAALQAGCKDSGTSSGYGVVDPMPPPSRCMGVAGGIKATATWKQGETALYIEIILAKPEQPDAHYVSTEQPVVYSAKITASDIKDDALTIALQPNPEATGPFWVTVPVECAAGLAHVSVSLTPGKPEAGANVPASVTDQF